MSATTNDDSPRENSGICMVCSWCGTTAPIPAQPGREWQELWDAGWRWRGAEEETRRLAPRSTVFSCPSGGCPDVLAQYPWNAPHPPVLTANRP